jgi:L-rhamnose mutarotase
MYSSPTILRRPLVPVIALHTILKAGREPDYDSVHESIPADLASALMANGVHDWRIWRDGRDVFHVVDVDDYDAMRASLRDLPANLEWQQTVGPLFDVPDSYEGGDSGIAHVWSLSEQVAASGPEEQSCP